MTATPAESAQPDGNRESMSAMGNHSAEGHVTDKPRRDHLWVLILIAACVLAEVWPSWVGIGAIAGFPRLGRMPTDWVLAVAMEAYWAYTLWAWLAASPGPRSRAWAMWSCAVVFAFSLTCQVLDHELTVAPGTPLGRRFVIGFVTSLPVVVLALIAVLIHLRHMDREEAVKVAERATREARRLAAEADAADDRTALRDALEAERVARNEAQRQAAEATARAATLERKLAATGGAKRARNAGAKKPATAARNKGANDPAAKVPDDVDARAEALAILDAEPGISGAKLGPRVGMSERWGQLLKSELATVPPGGDGDRP